MATNLVNLRTSVSDTEKSAGLIDRRIVSSSSEADTYVLRGLEVGPGLKVKVVDFDDQVFKTKETKILLSLDPGAISGGISTLEFRGENGIQVIGGPIVGSGSLVISAQLASETQPGMMSPADKQKLELITSVNTGDQRIVVDGDMVGGGGPSTGNPINLTLNLKPSGVRAGTYRNPTLTVNDRGIITNITNGVDVEGGGSGSGETNTGENIGPGIGVFAKKQGVSLQFKSLIPGPGVDIQEFTDMLVITATGGSSGEGGDADYTLQKPTDGTYQDGAIKNWIPGVTTYSDAIDDLNEFMTKLMPKAPPSLDLKELIIRGWTNVRGSAQIMLVQGATDNTGNNPLSAGTQVYRVAGNNFETEIVKTFASGNSGNLKAKVNGFVVGQRNLTAGVDAGTYDALVIDQDVDYPESLPGFHQALDAHIASTAPIGVTQVDLTHSETGSAKAAIFVTDRLDVTPAVSGVVVTERTPGTLFYSSGVPHYPSGAEVNWALTVSGLAVETYLDRGLLSVDTLPLIGDVNPVNPGQGGIPLVLTRNQPAINVSGLFYTMGGVAHTTSQLRGRGSNPQTDSPWAMSPTYINYASGTPAGCVIEQSRSMSGATLKRIAMGPGSRPNDLITSFSAVAFDSGNATHLGNVEAAHEAVIRGGVLRCDQTNYKTGWLPVGPDYSAKPGEQYATFAIKKIASNMVVTFQGSDPAEVWIKLPGLPQAMPGATNGWWDAKKLVDFAPGQWPGVAGASDGCRTGGSNGTYNISFGSASSAYATDNIVLIRVKLTAGQSVNNITVTI